MQIYAASFFSRLCPRKGHVPRDFCSAGLESGDAAPLARRCNEC
jgi:hypothetical protein